MPHFDQPPKNWKEITDFICQTSLGKTIVTTFMPFLDSGRIQIEFFPTEIRNKLVRLAAPKTPLGAAFVTDGSQGTIYIDLQSELGILIPFLFHELIHSLDLTLWHAAQNQLSIKEKQEIIFQAECKAFQFQHLFQEEFRKIYPNFQQFIQTQYPHISYLNRALSKIEIAKLYGHSLPQSSLRRGFRP